MKSDAKQSWIEVNHVNCGLSRMQCIYDVLVGKNLTNWDVFEVLTLIQAKSNDEKPKLVNAIQKRKKNMNNNRTTQKRAVCD